MEIVAPVYALTEEQKITKFEAGLAEDKAISYSIQAKTQWNGLPPNQQNFDSYYNFFSAYMNKHNSLSASNNRRSRISQVSGRGGRGRGRPSTRGGGGRGGRGRGGRSGRSTCYNPYQMARSGNSDFGAEARIYQPDEYRNFTREQRQEITDLKVKTGWIDGNTPPPGFVLDNDGRPALSTHLVAAVRASMVGELRTTNDPNDNVTALVAPPIPPTGMPPPVPPVIMTQPLNAGHTFGRAGSRVRGSGASTIATVTINGRSYTGPVFDAQGNTIT